MFGRLLALKLHIQVHAHVHNWTPYTQITNISYGRTRKNKQIQNILLHIEHKNKYKTKTHILRIQTYPARVWPWPLKAWNFAESSTKFQSVNLRCKQTNAHTTRTRHTHTLRMQKLSPLPAWICGQKKLSGSGGWMSWPPPSAPPSIICLSCSIRLCVSIVSTTLWSASMCFV